MDGSQDIILCTLGKFYNDILYDLQQMISC